MLGLSGDQSPSWSYLDDFADDNEPTKSHLFTTKDAAITQEISRDLGAPCQELRVKDQILEQKIS